MKASGKRVSQWKSVSARFSISEYEKLSRMADDSQVPMNTIIRRLVSEEAARLGIETTPAKPLAGTQPLFPGVKQ